MCECIDDECWSIVQDLQPFGDAASVTCMAGVSRTDSLALHRVEATSLTVHFALGPWQSGQCSCGITAHGSAWKIGVRSDIWTQTQLCTNQVKVRI